MEQNRLEIIKSLDEQRSLHLNHVDEIKAEAEKHLCSVKTSLESQISTQKVCVDALCVHFDSVATFCILIVLIPRK